MTRIAFALLLVITSGALALRLAFHRPGSNNPPYNPPQSRPSPTPEDLTSATARYGNAPWTKLKHRPQIVYHQESSGFTQKLSYGAAFDLEDHSYLAIMNYASAWDPEPQEEWVFSAAFDIHQAVAKGRDHFYVLGESQSGETIIQRWKKKPLSMPSQPSSYTLSRKEIYRGTSLGDVRGLGVDHLGRFLLVNHGAPATISQVPLPSGVPITPVFDEFVIPELTAAHGAPVPRAHAFEGIVWRLNLDSGDLLIWDWDDNGVMDTWGPFSQEEFLDEYSLGSGVWIDNFVTKQ